MKLPTGSSSPHPPPYRLEALAAGDDDAAARAHVAACEACAQYLDGLRARAERFRAANDAGAFVQRAAVRSARRRAARWSRAATIAAPLVAAAAVLVWVRGRPRDATHTAPATRPPAAYAPDLRFKGGLAVAVIRDRGGRQERLAGDIHVRAGDRVRVEVSTDHESPVTAGLLLDDGQWVPLLAPASLAAGTHYSEVDARFDPSPTHATLLVGAPADVDRARRTHDFAGVVAWRVDGEAGP